MIDLILSSGILGGSIIYATHKRKEKIRLIERGLYCPTLGGKTAVISAVRGTMAYGYIRQAGFIQSPRLACRWDGQGRCDKGREFDLVQGDSA